AEAARALRVPAASLDPALPLTAQGLDSLSATQLAARVEETTGVPLDAVALLGRRSVRDLARELSALAPGGAVEEVPAADGVGETVFPLSPGQQALWFLHRLAPASAAYNLAVAVRVRGALDARLLAESLRTVAGRHAALRTAIDAEEPVQRVLPDAGWAPAEHDASGWSDDALRRRLDDEARRPFALGGEPPVRAELFRRGADDHVLLLAAHHVLLDFRSLEIVFDETFRAYAALAAGEAPSLPEVRAQHPRFVRWQEALLAGPEGERLRALWPERLAGAPTVLALPADRPRPGAQGHRGAAHVFTLDPALAGRLRALARAEGVTPYTLLLAAFQALLGRWSGQADFLVGSPASGRARAAFAETVGYLVNPVVLRARLDDDPPFRVFLRRAQEEALGALAGQAYPFERLVEALHPERDASRTPVFQVLFVLQQADRSGAATACALGRDGVREERGPLLLESLAVETGAAQFDLALAMGEVEGTLAGSLRYDADLFEPATARRMAGHFVRLLEGIAAAPDTPVAALPLLPPEEERQVLLGFNATDARYPSAGVPLYRLVEARAARTPDAVAVVFEGDALTYAELDRRAAVLADTLRGLGVGPETRVGVCMERSPELVVALLGALKAGGAYVPLDPEYPAERLAYMLEDSAVPVLVTQARVREKAAGYGGEVVVLDGAPTPGPSPASRGGENDVS
ncbi:MAG TPA: condensation domain-containing protein, partial [Longimicrobiaceae bacterium]